MSKPTIDQQLAAIYEGTKDSLHDAMLGSDKAIIEAITEGVRKAFDQLWADDIKAAIEEGVRQAMKP